VFSPSNWVQGASQYGPIGFVLVLGIFDSFLAGILTQWAKLVFFNWVAQDPSTQLNWAAQPRPFDLERFLELLNQLGV